MLPVGDAQTNPGTVGAAAAAQSTRPPRLGAVSFLLRPRVTALVTNELRRRARRGLHDTAPRLRPPSFPRTVAWNPEDPGPLRLLGYPVSPFRPGRQNNRFS